MATGSQVGWVPNVPPLEGDFNMVQNTAATDHMTLTSVGNAAAGAHLVWRTSAGTEQGLISGAGNLILKDNIELNFGSLSTAGGDIRMLFDATRLQVLPSTANTAAYFGDTTSGLDVRFVGAGAPSTTALKGPYVEWDASASRLTFRASTAINRSVLNLGGKLTTTTVYTTIPTGMIKGDLFLIGSSATMLRLGVCMSTATGIAQYTRKFDLGPGSSS